MKLALFTIAMLVISSSAFAQPGQNASGFYHVTKSKKLNKRNTPECCDLLVSYHK